LIAQKKSLIELDIGRRLTRSVYYFPISRGKKGNQPSIHTRTTEHIDHAWHPGRRGASLVASPTRAAREPPMVHGGDDRLGGLTPHELPEHLQRSMAEMRIGIFKAVPSTLPSWPWTDLGRVEVGGRRSVKGSEHWSRRTGKED
jgi:hypothetical protein